MRIPGKFRSLVLGAMLGLISMMMVASSGASGDGPLVFSVPSDTNLSISPHNVELLGEVIASETGLEVETQMMLSSAEVSQNLADGSADLGIVTNSEVKKRLKNFQPIANFTKGKNHPFRLQIVVPSAGGASTLAELASFEPTIALDVDRSDRRWFLLERFGSAERPGGGRVVIPQSSLEALKGVASGRFDAACIENNLMDTFARFSRGEFNQLKVLTASAPVASDIVVGRKGLSPTVVEGVRRALLNLEGNSTGQQILISLHITRFVPPESNGSLYPSKPVVRQQPSPTATPAPTPTSEPSPSPIPEIEALPEVEISPATPEPTPEASLVPTAVAEPEALEQTPVKEAAEKKSASADGTGHQGLPVSVVVLIGLAVMAAGVGLFLTFGKKKIQDDTAPYAGPEHEQPEEVFEPDTDHGVAVPHSDEESDLVGELHSFGVPDLLQLIGSARHTGTLEIESFGGERAIHFDDGYVCGATCLRPDSKNNFGAVMLRMGFISEGEFDVTQRLCRKRPGVTLREAVEELGLARPEQLRAAARRQAEEVVYTILLSPEGRFRFLRDDKPSCFQGLQIAVTDLIMEGARRVDEWRRIRKIVSRDSLIPRVSVAFSVSPDGVALDEEEAHILASIDGKRSVEGVAAAACRFDFASTAVIAGLVQRGVVELS